MNLLWQGVQFPNNSILNIEDIGEGEHALVCQTDKRPCCRPIYDVYYHRHRIGEWYYPNGSRVPIQGGGATFYRNRNDDGMVRLNRRNHEIDYSTGIYCCVVPDASDVNRTLCIGLLSIGGTSSCSLSREDNNF